MYLDTASSLPLPPGDIVDAGADGVLAQRLWQQVRTAFPDLPGSRFRLEKAGGDHLLLIADEQRAFRFPRPGKHGLKLEIAVLRRLARHGLVAIPDYDVVDPAGRFASYILIAGLPLTPARFSALSHTTGCEVIADAVAVLSSLHGLEPRAFRLAEDWPRMWSQVQFADRLQKARLPLLTDRMPTLTTPIAHFLERYRVDQAPREVVLHGDLVGDHLLMNEHTGLLTGIIDFSDVALGDPAHDFLGFWAYGASAAAHAVAVYGQFDADPTLLARSRNHFIRYRMDRLFEMIADGAGTDAIRTHSAALAVLLAEPLTCSSHA